MFYLRARDSGRGRRNKVSKGKHNDMTDNTQKKIKGETREQNYTGFRNDCDSGADKIKNITRAVMEGQEVG